MNPLPFILLAISLPLLLGGCGVEEPKLEGVNVEEIEERKGIAYLKGSDTPYTGKIYKLYENGQKRGELNYKDGKKEGLGIAWHKNGQKASEANFKDGKIVSQKDWDEEGKLIE